MQLSFYTLNPNLHVQHILCKTDNFTVEKLYKSKEITEFWKAVYHGLRSFLGKLGHSLDQYNTIHLMKENGLFESP
jgi:hypothetical protein